MGRRDFFRIRCTCFHILSGGEGVDVFSIFSILQVHFVFCYLNFIVLITRVIIINVF